MSTKMKFVIEVGFWDRKHRRPVRLNTVVRVETGQRESMYEVGEAAEVMQEMLGANLKAMWDKGHPFHTLDVDVHDLWAESEGPRGWGTEAEVTLEIYDTLKKSEIGLVNESQLDLIDADPLWFLNSIASEVASIASSNEWLVAVALKKKPEEPRTFTLDFGERHPALVDYLRELGVADNETPVKSHVSADDIRGQLTEKDVKTLVGNIMKDPANVTAEEVAKVLQQSLWEVGDAV